MKILIPLIGALLFFTACIRDKTESKKAEAVEFNEIEPRIEPIIDSKSTIFLIKWDFNKEKKYIYSYESIDSSSSKRTVSDFGGKSAQTNYSESYKKGRLTIHSKGNGFADLILEIEAAYTLEFDSNHVFVDTSFPIKEKYQPLLIQDMSEKGTFPVEGYGMNLVFDLFVALPQDSVYKNEVVSMPYAIPVKVMGSKLYNKGENKIKIVDKGDNTLELQGEHKINLLKIPALVKSKVKMNYQGFTNVNFDMKKKCAEMAELHVESNVYMKPYIDKDEFKFFSDYETENKSKSSIKIKLLKIELNK